MDYYSLSRFLDQGKNFTMALKDSLVFRNLAFPNIKPAPECKCFPGDECWPAASMWQELNDTVGGRLIETLPLAAPCHDPLYDRGKCRYLQDQWLDSIIQ